MRLEMDPDYSLSSAGTVNGVPIRNWLELDGFRLPPLLHAGCK